MKELEEIAEAYRQTTANKMYIEKEAFKEGVKWAKKTMYTEKEVLKMFHDYIFKFYTKMNMQVFPEMFEEWFEKYKK